MKKKSPILTKLAKYWLSSVTSGPLCELRRSTLAQMKGINVLSKNLCGNNFLVRVGGRYLKKTSPILTKLAKYWLSSVCSRPLLDLRRSTVSQMKGINVVSKNLRGKLEFPSYSTHDCPIPMSGGPGQNTIDWSTPPPLPSFSKKQPQSLTSVFPTSDSAKYSN